MNALRNLGPIEAVRCVGSYLWVRVHPPKDKSTLEGFVVSRFGWRLYGHFFKTQSEKVWGVPVHGDPGRLGRAAHQEPLALPGRVGGAQAEVAARPKASKSKQVTSLIEEFNYPKYGPGMMWERCAELVTAQGTKIVFDATVTKVEHRDGQAVAVTARHGRCSDAPRVHRRDLVDADRRAAAGDGPAAARRRRSPRPTRCATATSSPSRSSCPRPSGSPTTGSTSTTRRSKSAASRTSASGRRTWSRTGARASASSSSCGRATTCGRRTTPT